MKIDRFMTLFLIQRYKKPTKCLSKAFILFLGLAGLAMMTGCKPTQPLAVDPSDSVTIKLSTWGSAQEVATLRSELARFESANPTIHVELLHIPDNYYQKLHILVAAGLTPDVVFTNSIYLPVYASQGVFRDLGPLLKQEPQFANAPFYPVALEALSWKGQLFALPRDVSNLVVFINRDAFRNAGVRLPHSNWTWNDFLSVSKRLTSDNDKDGHPERFGVSFNRTPPLFWLPYVWSAGGNLVNEARNRCLLNQPASLNGLAFYADLRNRHHVAPRQDESGSATMSDFFLQQKIAMMVSGRWSVPVLREQAKFQWDVVPFPKGTAGSRVGIDASGYAIASATKHPEAAWKLVRHLLSRKAVEDVTASGLIVPARQEVAESRVFLEPGKSPANSKAFLLAMDHGVPTQSVPRWNEVAEVVNLALEPAWDGKKTVADALKNTCTQVDAMLETGS